MKKNKIDMLIESYLLEDAIECNTPVISLEDYELIGNDFVPMSPMLRELVGAVGGMAAGMMTGNPLAAVAGGAAGHLAQKKMQQEDFDLEEDFDLMDEDTELCEGEGCGEVSEGKNEFSKILQRTKGINTGKPVQSLKNKLMKIKEEYNLTNKELKSFLEQEINPAILNMAKQRLKTLGPSAYSKPFSNVSNAISGKKGLSSKNVLNRRLRAVNNGIDLSEDYELEDIDLMEDFDLDEGFLSNAISKGKEALGHLGTVSKLKTGSGFIPKGEAQLKAARAQRERLTRMYNN